MIVPYLQDGKKKCQQIYGFMKMSLIRQSTFLVCPQYENDVIIQATAVIFEILQEGDLATNPAVTVQ